MGRYSACDATSLFYRDEGQGLPLICLAGLTRCGSDFDYVMPYLRGCRVIRPDYRGRGRSDWAAPDSYTVTTEAQDVLALMDHLNLDRAAFLGTSRGGLIAMALAASPQKDRMIGVCLNDIGPRIEPIGLERIVHYVGKKPPFKTYEQAVKMLAVAMQGFEGVSAERWLEEVHKHYKETPDGLQIPYDPALGGAFSQEELAGMPDIWPLFDALQGMPLALIRGENSDILSKETAARMRHRRPDMRFADVPGRGHVPFLDEPEAVAIIQAFIGDCKR